MLRIVVQTRCSSYDCLFDTPNLGLRIFFSAVETYLLQNLFMLMEGGMKQVMYCGTCRVLIGLIRRITAMTVCI